MTTLPLARLQNLLDGLITGRYRLLTSEEYARQLRDQEELQAHRERLEAEVAALRAELQDQETQP